MTARRAVSELVEADLLERPPEEFAANSATPDFTSATPRGKQALRRTITNYAEACLVRVRTRETFS